MGKKREWQEARKIKGLGGLDKIKYRYYNIIDKCRWEKEKKEEREKNIEEVEEFENREWETGYFGYASGMNAIQNWSNKNKEEK